MEKCTGYLIFKFAVLLAISIIMAAGCKKKDDKETFSTVTNPVTGKIWMDRNLGASHVATGSNDTASYGYLFQWGRAADGHQLRTAGTTNTLSGSSTPGHNLFICSNGSPVDWLTLQNDNLWQGASDVNNPCPEGFRLPTEAEFSAERACWISQNATGAFASALKLPTAGSRHNTGYIFGEGSVGNYWCSSVDGTFSRRFYFGSTNSETFSTWRASGLCVRCIQE